MIDFGLTKTEWKLLQLLVTQNHPSKQMIMAELYDEKYGYAPPSPKILDVFICKIRKKLKPFGVEIHTHYGRGYYLTPTDKHVLLVQTRAEMLKMGQLEEAAT